MSLPTVTAAMICHNDRMQARRKYYEMSCWTRRPDELIVLSSVEDFHTFVSHTRTDARIPVPTVHVRRPDMDDKGYDKRAHALRIAKSDFIVFVNYDDIHDLHFLERMMAEVTEAVKIVHCRVGGKYGYRFGDQFVPFNSGAENHIIRVSYALERGGYEPCIERHRQHAVAADAVWLNTMKDGCQPDEIKFVDEVLIIML